MSISVASSLWYRIAPLRIRLRRDASVHRHSYRGQVWYVLQDKVTGRFMRFSPEAYQLIGRMDGSRSVAAIYEEAKKQLGRKMPSQRELVTLIGQLYRANVVLTDQAPDVGAMAAHSAKARWKTLTRQFMMPLAIRIPLFDPERFLERTRLVSHIVFSWPSFAVWLLAVFVGAILAVINWPALTANLSDRVLATENLLLMVLVYPIVKALHELGHAYAIKRFGGEVHEIGVMLLAFYPVPYVDATASTAFRSKCERMLVGLAGIFVEVLLAALAMAVWTLAEPGVLRAVCLNVMLISGISTLIFNGNPLLRFDAYYVLADAIEIPNLASRGNQYIAYWTKRLLGVPRPDNPSHEAGEGAWLAGYAIASFCYRIFVMVAISVFVATQYFFVGAVLAVWSVYLMLIFPTVKAVTAPMRDFAMRPIAKRIYSIGGAVLLLILAILFLLPMPYRSQMDGVVWVKDAAVLRAGSSGILSEIKVANGEEVASGQEIIVLTDPVRQTDVQLLKAQLEEAEIRYQAHLREPVTAAAIAQRIKILTQELDKAALDQQAQTLLSPMVGRVVLPHQESLIGRYIEKGRRLGYIATPEHLQLIVPVLEADIDRILNDTHAIKVRFVSDIDVVRRADLTRFFPSATKSLPSAAFSLAGGGDFALDPVAKDPLTAFKEFYLIELDVEDMPLRPAEERAHVLFYHSAEPIGFRFYRSVRRAFLRQFDV